MASVDIGKAAAALMREAGAHRRLIELHGPADYSPDDKAAALARVLGREVKAVEVPSEEWIGTFQRQCMPEIAARGFAEMYEGFNRELIAFEGGHETRFATTSLEQVIAEMVASADSEHNRRDQPSPRKVAE